MRRQQSQVKFDEQQGQVRWNEDHFHLDNTQQGQNHFGIRPTDTLRPGVFSDAAPSRPPSRVSARVTTTANGKLGLVVARLQKSRKNWANVENNRRKSECYHGIRG